jgi:hypothetical protein
LKRVSHTEGLSVALERRRQKSLDGLDRLKEILEKAGGNWAIERNPGRCFNGPMAIGPM